MSTYTTVIFQPYGKRILVSDECLIIEAARKAGVGILSLCGGRGLCGKCRVIVRQGIENLSIPSESEKRILCDEDLKDGCRLACQSKIISQGQIVIEVPRESQIEQQKLLLLGIERAVKIEPVVKKITIEMEKPSLDNLRADVDRVIDAVEAEVGFRLNIDYKVLRSIPRVLRLGDWIATLTIWNDKEIIGAEPGLSRSLYGVAFDIGTTKIVCFLVDLNNGEILAMSSMMNPQIPYGEDIISRIRYTLEHDNGLETLHKSLISGVNNLIEECCKSYGISADEIVDMTFVGNTAMHHFFLGIETRYVTFTPYPPALSFPVNVKARDVGIRINEGAYVHALPIIAGFVGSDAIADILATGIHESDKLSMIIDIGTNTEIILGDKKGLWACSCASGPAFEGAHIKYGMRASTGAIEHVWINPESLEVGYTVIGGEKPRGLCGSAVVDAVAEMLKAGIIDRTGRYTGTYTINRLRRKDGISEFVIAGGGETAIMSDIVVTQEDIREIQLAKAAIYAGASILMRRMGITLSDIEQVYLSGAFGNYVDPQNAKIIGMYPDVPLEKVKFAGNTAGSGARMALLSSEVRREAERISRRVKYVELGADPSFQKEFLEATYLPHHEIERFPNVTKLLIDMKT
ncbi:MAG: ASKHA domain-containing protein [Nitrososphaerota archaeon]|nr:ASKHA domain-containing protein [Nitrososphaerota archaeon]